MVLLTRKRGNKRTKARNAVYTLLQPPLCKTGVRLGWEERLSVPHSCFLSYPLVKGGCPQDRGVQQHWRWKHTIFPLPTPLNPCRLRRHLVCHGRQPGSISEAHNRSPSMPNTNTVQYVKHRKLRQIQSAVNNEKGPVRPGLSAVAQFSASPPAGTTFCPDGPGAGPQCSPGRDSSVFPHRVFLPGCSQG